MTTTVDRFRISRSAFENWGQNVLSTPKPPTVRTIAQVGNFAKSTVAKQLKEDDIDPRFIIGMSRSLNLKPLRELSKFSGYEALSKTPPMPPIEQRLTLVGLPDLMVEILKRFRTKPVIMEETSYPLATQTWYPWFKLAAPHATLADCQQILGLSTAAVSRNHTRANWGVSHILAMAASLHFDPHMALVASGLISPEEAGFSYKLREESVKEATIEELQNQLTQLAPRLAELLNQQQENLYRGLTYGRLA